MKKATQEDLANYIENTGCKFHVKIDMTGGWDIAPWHKAREYVEAGVEIRIALTPFGLPSHLPEMNPDNVPAEVLTEGDKYRAWTQEDFNRPIPEGVETWCLENGWQPGGGISSHMTYRLPATIPFSDWEVMSRKKESLEEWLEMAEAPSKGVFLVFFDGKADEAVDITENGEKRWFRLRLNGAVPIDELDGWKPLLPPAVKESSTPQPAPGDTPEVLSLLQQILASGQDVDERSAPARWVKLAKKLERERNAAIREVAEQGKRIGELEGALERLPAILYESDHIAVYGDGCCSRSRDIWILSDLIKKALNPKGGDL